MRSDAHYPSVIALVEGKTSELMAEAQYYLHPDELDYFRSLKFGKRQHSYLLGRCCAKIALATYTGMAPYGIEIVSGVFGQPVVKIPHNANIQVSISHADDWAVAIVFPEEHPMGIDIESLSVKNQQIINKSLTSLEKEHVLAMKQEALLGHLLIWTAREALSKVIRCGLTIPFPLLEVQTVDYNVEYQCFISRFSNFPQYKTLSCEIDGNLISVVLPERTEIPTKIF